MCEAYPGARVLVRQVPVGRTNRACIEGHALRAGLEGVVGAETAREDAEPKLEHAVRLYDQALNCSRGHVWATCNKVVAQDGARQRDLFWHAQVTVASRAKLRQFTGQVVLCSTAAVPEQDLAGLGRQTISREAVIPACPAEHGLIGEPLR